MLLLEISICFLCLHNYEDSSDTITIATSTTTDLVVTTVFCFIPNNMNTASTSCFKYKTDPLKNTAVFAETLPVSFQWSVMG